MSGSTRCTSWQSPDTGCMGQKTIKVGTLHKLGCGVMGSSLSMGTVFHVIKIFQYRVDMMATQPVTTENATEFLNLQ